ncbi:MAG: SusC/RagA family TonB-linked outer membrane protein [Phocaeicola sp.]|uniref:SusC/RagA family TonB-linked outer membrane protein n=1 Tax=Phocaeicola sp. TaxID=2773926 RepID=UPI0023C82732|nr:SusC/RagA family TonB-linked outer membrane protein [Phocaeicola sp.]MDE5677830.1 SusC/RagA family TonB-linked outer membrane protein [Phocaeicola sp.]MDE6181282.1 SusC/RagA family TonB-linked outer membrane protein [Phocaeicola sp.]
MTVVVEDELGPITGASVVVKGTTDGSVTDLDGKVVLENISNGSVIQISFVGYITQEIKYTGQSNVQVKLKEDTQKLDEVVVVGYTSQKKGLLAGSVETTKFTESLAEIPTNSAAQSLIGKMSGVHISVPAGKPGEQASVGVRTGTTWNTSPLLYVIDGAVRDATTFNNLSPNEIESVSVLKDAASAAVYGARSDAGVILVTTRSGNSGKISVNYTANFSADFATQEVKLNNLYQQGLTVNQAYKNFGLTAPQGEAWSEEELEWAKKLPGQGFNMLDDTWHTPYVMNHALSISGGSERIKFFGAVNYYTQNGFMESTEYNKLNMRLNVTADITNNLQLYASIANTNTKYGSSPTEGTDATYTKARVSFEYMPSRTPDGKWVGDGWAYGNPAAAAEGASGYRRNVTMNPEANISLTYKLPWIKGLSAKVAYMGSWKTQRAKEYIALQRFYYPKKSGANNHIIDVTDLDNYYISNEGAGIYGWGKWWVDQQLNFQINYDNRWGNHHVNAAAVYEASNNNYHYVWANRDQFPLYQTDQFWAAGSSVDKQFATGGPDTDGGRASWVFVGGYDYANKYILNFSVRYDGSMNFAPSERWGVFPAVSAAWVASEENFLKDVEWLDFLKLRGSVALTGNDAVGGWQWQTSYQNGGSYMFGENASVNNGLQYGSLVNEFLTWEKSTGINVGVDFRFLNHLHGAVEYWHKHTFDILGNRQNSLPTTFSKTMPAENYGVINGQGFDFNVGWEDHFGKVNWHADMNLSYGWNKVKVQDYAAGLFDWEIPVGKDRSYIAAYEGRILRTQAEVDAFKKENPNYVMPTGGGVDLRPGSFVYIDKSGPDGVKDGIINKYDKEVLYNNNNPIYMGLNLGVTWKGLAVEATFTGKFHNYKNFGAISDYYGNQMWNREWVENSWTPENPNAELPMVAPPDYRSYAWTDVDFYWKKANYVRLSNLNIGYTFNFARPLGNAISSIKVFATGTNLFYISGFKHWDPELNPGWSGVGYPVMRTLGGGVSVNF